MIWILTAFYFLVCSLLIFIGFCIYGRALAFFGKFGAISKNLGGLFVYLLFACFLVVLFFLVASFLEGWRIKFSSDPLYGIYFMLLFLLAGVPGGLYFKNNYLSDLKKLGYFAKRR